MPSRRRPALDDYRRVRKRVPPPGRIEPDRRRALRRRDARREVDQALRDRRRGRRARG